MTADRAATCQVAVPWLAAGSEKCGARQARGSPAEILQHSGCCEGRRNWLVVAKLGEKEEDGFTAQECLVVPSPEQICFS